MTRRGLAEFAHMAREECESALDDIQKQRTDIARHLKKLLGEKDSGKLRPQLIASLITAEAICLDKQHQILMRLRDLEAFGVDESTEIGAIIIQQDDDGKTHLVGEPPAWAHLVAKAGGCAHCADP